MYITSYLLPFTDSSDQGGFVLFFFPFLFFFSPPHPIPNINLTTQSLKILKFRVDWNQIHLCPSAAGLLFREAWKVPGKPCLCVSAHRSFVVETQIFVLRKQQSSTLVGPFPLLRIRSSTLSSLSALPCFNVWQSMNCKHVIRLKGSPEMVAEGEQALKKRGVWLKMNC